MPGLRLTFEERCEIGSRLSRGSSLRGVAAALGRPCSTVAREVARNGGARSYIAFRAQHRWNHTKRRPKPFRLETNRRLARQVERLLLPHLGPGERALQARPIHPGHWRPGLLLRPRTSMAARDRREHRWPNSSVPAEGHQHGRRPNRPQSNYPRTQPPPAQDPWMGQPCRGLCSGPRVAMTGRVRLKKSRGQPGRVEQRPPRPT